MERLVAENALLARKLAIAEADLSELQPPPPPLDTPGFVNLLAFPRVLRFRSEPAARHAQESGDAEAGARRAPRSGRETSARKRKLPRGRVRSERAARAAAPRAALPRGVGGSSARIARAAGCDGFADVARALAQPSARCMRPIVACLAHARNPADRACTMQRADCA
jgi:hypothetical protein